MIKPAILYKNEIIWNFQERYYTEDMFYETGGLGNWCPEIADCPDETKFQFAILNSQEQLIGYIDYKIDWYADCAYNFGLISFDKGNVIIGKELFNVMEKLVERHHRIEWRMIGGNPVEDAYDRFCNKHGGIKHILKDCIKDADGNYRDSIIYEIVNRGK